MNAYVSPLFGSGKDTPTGAAALWEVLDLIASLPEIQECADIHDPKGDVWSQDDLVYEGECGTAACVAGWRALLDGLDPDAVYVSGLPPEQGGYIKWALSRFGLDYEDGSIDHIELWGSGQTLEEITAYAQELYPREVSK